jgi:hypothetical protein
MFIHLNGQEAGLVGLWNFDDGTANDASAGAHHGTLVGAAKIISASLPTSEEILSWSRLTVVATDTAGLELTNVTIRAEVNGTESARAMTGRDGTAWLMLRTSAKQLN